MADTIPPGEGVQGPVGVEIDLHNAWYRLMDRIGVYGPKMVYQGSLHLDAVDRITGISTKRLPV